MRAILITTLLFAFASQVEAQGIEDILPALKLPGADDVCAIDPITGVPQVG